MAAFDMSEAEADIDVPARVVRSRPIADFSRPAGARPILAVKRLSGLGREAEGSRHWRARSNSRASASHHIGRDLLQFSNAMVIGHYLEYIGVAPLPA